MEFVPLSRFSLSEQVDAFHAAFSNYFLPIQLTEDSLARKILNDRIDLERSVAAVESGKLCGFIYQGFGEWEGESAVYNAGTGVLPEARGKSLTRNMYEYTLPQLKERQVKTMVLEAIEANHAAIHIYKSVGYAVTRTLTSWRMVIPPRATTKLALELDLPEELSLVVPDGWATISPSWQFMQEALESDVARIRRLEARYKQRLVGVCFFLPQHTRILQMAVDPDHRGKGIGRAMMDYIFRFEGKPHIVNVEACDELNVFFKACGFQPFIQQVEMVARLEVGRRQ